MRWMPNAAPCRSSWSETTVEGKRRNSATTSALGGVPFCGWMRQILMMSSTLPMACGRQRGDAFDDAADLGPLHRCRQELPHAFSDGRLAVLLRRVVHAGSQDGEVSVWNRAVWWDQTARPHICAAEERTSDRARPGTAGPAAGRRLVRGLHVQLSTAEKWPRHRRQSRPHDSGTPSNTQQTSPCLWAASSPNRPHLSAKGGTPVPQDSRTRLLAQLRSTRRADDHRRAAFLKQSTAHRVTVGMAGAASGLGGGGEGSGVMRGRRDDASIRVRPVQMSRMTSTAPSHGCRRRSLRVQLDRPMKGPSAPSSQRCSSSRPSTRRGIPHGFASCSQTGSSASGKFWKATGRRNRSTACMPTEVVDAADVAG